MLLGMLLSLQFVFSLPIYTGNIQALSLVADPYGYDNEYQDGEDSTVYLRARNYDAKSGEFISQDSYDFFNRYLSFSANPVGDVDPSGHKSKGMFHKSFWKNKNTIMRGISDISLIVSSTFETYAGFQISSTYMMASGLIQMQDALTDTITDIVNNRASKIYRHSHARIINDSASTLLSLVFMGKGYSTFQSLQNQLMNDRTAWVSHNCGALVSYSILRKLEEDVSEVPINIAASDIKVTYGKRLDMMGIKDFLEKANIPEERFEFDWGSGFGTATDKPASIEAFMESKNYRALVINTGGHFYGYTTDGSLVDGYQAYDGNHTTLSKAARIIKSLKSKIFGNGIPEYSAMIDFEEYFKPNKYYMLGINKA